MKVLNVIADRDKASKLESQARSIRDGVFENKVYASDPIKYRLVPGAPFCYWANEVLMDAFSLAPPFESGERFVRIGLTTHDDFRWLRLRWELTRPQPLFAKGGSFSKYYVDLHLSVLWGSDGFLLKESKKARFLAGELTENNSKCWNESHYFRRGVTWPRRTNGLSFRLLPAGTIFGDKGPGAFLEDDDAASLLAICAVMNSRVFWRLVKMQLARVDLAQSFEVGLVRQTPIPNMSESEKFELAKLAREIWSLQRDLDSSEECSLAFLMPTLLRCKQGNWNARQIREEICGLEQEIDHIIFDLYDIEQPLRKEIETDADFRSAIWGAEDDVDESKPLLERILFWAVGVSFGRFDWRLATGEREVPPEPEPFDPPPTKSPGMLPDGDEPFHHHVGILVDDPGHPHDLPQLIESVLERIDVQAPENLRRWLQKDFFKEHLKRYSKSRRKAPIYWPLTTASGSYTLWIYYPDLDDQTLYTAVNDFLEPKLKLVGDELSSLRAKSNRSAAEERELERQQDLKGELIELRDTILEIAPTYQPNHDDGVQITAAPLWMLFCHKPWQKVLKDTWEKLEAGAYDWAHLAYCYWPDRVREKCKTDKSLAITHGLEELYEEPAA